MQIDAIYFPNSCSMAVAEARWEGGREKKGQREGKKGTWRGSGGDRVKQPHAFSARWILVGP